jgi:peptidoglycan/LPS O-acetylase OafA/YrhL
MMPAPGRALLSIQVLRAVAALAVTVAHTNAELGWVLFYLKLPNPMPGLVTGAAGVDLFFVISGFIMVYTTHDLFGGVVGAWTFVKRRLVRIVPLYWLMTGATIACWYWFGTSLHQEGATWVNIVTSLAFLPWPRGNTVDPIVGVGWSLNYEMFFYGLFALALVLPRRLGLAMLLALLLVAGYGTWASNEIPGYFLNHNLWSFAAGIGVALLYERVVLPQALAWASIAAGAAVLTASAVFEVHVAWHREIMWAAPCALIVLGAVYLPNPQCPAPPWRVLGFLGDASYSLYLTHGLAMVIFRSELQSQALALGAWSPWLYSAWLVVLSIVVAAAVYVAIERPMTRALQRLIARKRPPPVAAEEPAARLA